MATSLSETVKAVRSKRRSACEVLAECFQHISQVDPYISAFVRTYRELAELQAAEIDRSVERGEDPGPLAGVPVALKDNLALAGKELSCGSKMLEGYVSPYSATAVRRLIAAGAVVVGHTNMDEFGMGSSCENSAFFDTHNPWDLERVPGGSSGGSAAAVASSCVPLALGSDTGGSIRQPAALCGAVGLKPTYGRVSRYGLVAFASSLDQIGPITRSVHDAALVLEVIAGVDPDDAVSSCVPVVRYSRGLDRGIAGTRIGVVRQFEQAGAVEGLAPGVRASWTATLEGLARLGAEIVEVDLPTVQASIAAYYVLANSEASANLARFDGIRYGHRSPAGSLAGLYEQSRSDGLGTEVKRRILLGTFALSSGYYDAYYGKALAVVAQLTAELEAALNRCDVLMTPTSPTPAFMLGERTADPLAMSRSDVFTTPASLAGLPGLAVPCGLDQQGLPLSVQFIGRAFDERTILRCGSCLESLVEPLAAPTVVRAG